MWDFSAYVSHKTPLARLWLLCLLWELAPYENYAEGLCDELDRVLGAPLLLLLQEREERCDHRIRCRETLRGIPVLDDVNAVLARTHHLSALAAYQLAAARAAGFLLACDSWA